MSAFSKDIEAYYSFWYQLNDIYTAWAKAHGITINTLELLILLNTNKEQLTLKTICSKLYLPKQTIHAVIQGLENQGIVKRITAEKDKRTKLICLTKEGEAHTKKLLAPLSKIEEETFLKMTQSERTAIRESMFLLLEKLKESFYAEEERR